jgi:hypothetical protein
VFDVIVRRFKVIALAITALVMLSPTEGVANRAVTAVDAIPVERPFCEANPGVRQFVSPDRG